MDDKVSISVTIPGKFGTSNGMLVNGAGKTLFVEARKQVRAQKIH